MKVTQSPATSCQPRPLGGIAVTQATLGGARPGYCPPRMEAAVTKKGLSCICDGCTNSPRPPPPRVIWKQGTLGLLQFVGRKSNGSVHKSLRDRNQATLSRISVATSQSAMAMKSLIKGVDTRKLSPDFHSDISSAEMATFPQAESTAPDVYGRISRHTACRVTVSHCQPKAT